MWRTMQVSQLGQLILFNCTSWQHLRSYQVGFRLLNLYCRPSGRLGHWHHDQSHYPSIKLTSPCPVLVLPSTSIGNDIYIKFVIHCCDSAGNQTRDLGSTNLVTASGSAPAYCSIVQQWYCCTSTMVGRKLVWACYIYIIRLYNMHLYVIYVYISYICVCWFRWKEDIQVALVSSLMRPVHVTHQRGV